MRFDEDKVESLLLDIISANRIYVDESDKYMSNTKHRPDCYLIRAKLILYPEEFL